MNDEGTKATTETVGEKFDPRRLAREVIRMLARRVLRSGANGVGGPHDVTGKTPRGQVHGALRLEKIISHGGRDATVDGLFPNGLPVDARPEWKRRKRAQHG